MRAVLVATALGSMMALSPQVQAGGPEETISCLVNALLIGNPAMHIAGCLVGANDSDPLCAEVFDRATNLLKTYPCAGPCLAPLPNWAVVAVAFGSPGDQVTGVLECDGTPTVDATATVLAYGAGADVATGPLPNAAAMVCTTDGTPPASVDTYLVLCAPGP